MKSKKLFDFIEPKELDLFENFTTLRWVKWSKRKPKTNGLFLMLFNGKNRGLAQVHSGKLLTLEGLVNEEFKRFSQTFYWLEEIRDMEGFSQYLESIS